MRYYHTWLIYIYEIWLWRRRPFMVSDVVITIIIRFSVDSSTNPYCVFNVVGRTDGRTDGWPIGFSKLRLYAPLVFIYWLRSDYYRRVRTKYEYLMLFYRIECALKIEIITTDLAGGQTKSRTSNSKLQIFSTLRRQIRTTSMVFGSH